MTKIRMSRINGHTPSPRTKPCTHNVGQGFDCLYLYVSGLGGLTGAASGVTGKLGKTSTKYNPKIGPIKILGWKVGGGLRGRKLSFFLTRPHLSHEILIQNGTNTCMCMYFLHYNLTYILNDNRISKKKRSFYCLYNVALC